MLYILQELITLVTWVQSLLFAMYNVVFQTEKVVWRRKTSESFTIRGFEISMERGRFLGFTYFFMYCFNSLLI
jgi:hypothetical protein